MAATSVIGCLLILLVAWAFLTNPNDPDSAVAFFMAPGPAIYVPVILIWMVVVVSLLAPIVLGRLGILGGLGFFLGVVTSLFGSQWFFSNWPQNGFASFPVVWFLGALIGFWLDTHHDLGGKAGRNVKVGRR